MASTAVESVAAAIRIFRPSAKAIPVVGPIVEGVLESVLELYKHVELVRTNRKKAKELVERIGLLTYTIVNHSHLESLGLEGRERMASHLGVLESVLKDTNECIKRLRPRAGRVANTLKHIAQPTSDDEEIKRLNPQLDQAIQRFHLGASLETISNTFRDRCKEKRDTELKYLREILQPVHEALYDSNSAPPGCLDGTRKDVLDTIFDWACSDSEQRVFWLCGMAGTGKSTIAKSVCERIAEHLDSTHFDDPDVHLVTFFISHNATDRRSPFRMLRTLGFYLCRAIPSFRTSLYEELKSTPELVDKTMKAQLQSLFAVPLSKCTEAKPKIILVIDAFDECDRIDGREGGDFLPTLLSIIGQSELGIRLIFTSRNEQSIHDMFAPCRQERTLRLHEIWRATVDNDICAYLSHELNNGRTASSQLDSAQLDSLVKAAGGLFVYAATVARYLNSMVLFERAALITTLLEPARSSHEAVNDTPSPDYTLLDGMYRRILLEALPEGANESNRRIVAEAVYSVVVSLALVKDRISPQTLAALIGRDLSQVTAILMSLASVLTFESSTDPIRFLHASFYEFVLDPRRCGDLFAVPSPHTTLARGCLRIMNSRLREDLCGIEDPRFLHGARSGISDRIARCIPDELAYACMHWGAHLETSAAQSSLPDAVLKEINTELVQFCHSHLLHWVEALSLLQSDGAVSGTLRSILRSTRWARMEMISMPHVYSAMREVYEIVYRHGDAIAAAPLQIYTLAQIFGSSDRVRNQLPPTSLTHVQCLRQPGRISPSSTMRPNNCGSGSADKPEDYVFAVSQDGSHLVGLRRYDHVPFASTLGVDLLHLESGNRIPLPTQPSMTQRDAYEPLSWSSCLAISPSGIFVAYDVSGRQDSHIQLWTLRSSYLSASCYVNGWVSALTFSVDASCIYAVVLEAGDYPAKLSCRRFSLRSGILSEEARTVLHSFDDADRYWPNSAPGMPNPYCCEDWMRQACCHAPRPSDLHRSLRVRITATSRGITVAIAVTVWSDIRVWHLSSPRSSIVLGGCTGPVRDIDLSLGEDNRHLLASCSDDDGIILWDVQSGCRIATFFLDLRCAVSCALSSDGALLAVCGSAIDDTYWDRNATNLTLWDTRAPQCILGKYRSPSRRDWEDSAQVAFLPPHHDSSREFRLIVWDGMEEFRVHNLRPDSDSLWGRRLVNTAVFSSDGSIFATVILAGMGINIWKTSNGSFLHHLELHAIIGKQFQQLALFEVSLSADEDDIAVFAHCRVEDNHGLYTLRSHRQSSGGWTSGVQLVHGFDTSLRLDALSLSSSWEVVAHSDRYLPGDSDRSHESQVVTVRGLYDGGKRLRYLWSIFVGSKYCETTRIQLSPDGRILAVLWPVLCNSTAHSIRLWLVGQFPDQPYRIVPLPTLGLQLYETGYCAWRLGFSGDNAHVWCCNDEAYVVYEHVSCTELGKDAQRVSTFGCYSNSRPHWISYTSPAHPDPRHLFCIGEGEDMLPLAWFGKTVVLGSRLGELIVLRVDEDSLSRVSSYGGDPIDWRSYGTVLRLL